MSRSNHPAIRKLLREYADGLTTAEVSAHIRTHADHVRRALTDMPDTYVDRWIVNGSRGRPAAVWCIVVPPPNCPPPAKRLENA